MPEIDLVAAKALVASCPKGHSIPVSPSWLARTIAEIEAGRDAHARLGKAFGLPRGVTL